VKVYDPIARYYAADAAYYTEDIPFYREMVARAGEPILDVMCGTGRVLLPLAEAGHTLTGIDSSQAMLDIAHEHVRAAGVQQRVTLVQGDIRTAELPAHQFTLAFVAVNSFMHLERVKDQLAALETMRHALVSDGVIVLDLFNPNPAELAQEDNRLVLEREFDLDGRRVLKFVASETDLATQINAMTYLFDEIDEQGIVTRRTTSFNLRWFYRYELEHLLARAGFMLLSLYGSYDLDTYYANSDRLIVLATPRRGE
jgi:ubiquinone/menaquinone biosynthesis C-methylase UbiE